MSGATLFNLSLLTSDMWAVAIRVLFYQQQVIFLNPEYLSQMVTYYPICSRISYANHR